MSEQKDFADDPAGWASRWKVELAAARKALEPWQKRGDKIIRRFLDERGDSRNDGDTRLNLFTSNVQTLMALLFGKTPQVQVSRRFADSHDDQARVASEMLERLLNTDIESDDDGYKDSLKHALEDRLLPGLGNCRVRYEAQFETQPGQPAMLGDDGGELAPEVPGQEMKTGEKVCVDYVQWRDQLWSPARTFSEVRWWAFRSEMSREALVARFGDEVGAAVPLNTKTKNQQDDAKNETATPWSRADVWEVWDKEHKCVYWLSEGYDQTLDKKEDPLGLAGFWPFPMPMFANVTTTKLVPTPDFALAQDLYDEVDAISTRITLLERVIRVAGVYDKTNDGVRRLINETAANELIAVDSWGIFAEKGGVKGAVDWLPLEMVTLALDKLREYRTELIGLLFQVTGMSDIMRGQASQQTTATEQAIKARFASVRVQSLQDEFARFASDVQKLKAEIISLHFDPQTIMNQSNIMRTPDAQLAPQAVELIKSRFMDYRVVVNPDAVSLTDFAALKQERFEFMSALSGFFQAAVPIVQIAGPTAMPFLLEIASWSLAGLRGANEIEGVFDQGIAALKAQQAQAAARPPQPPPPDPKLQAAQVKAGAEQFKAKADMASTAMDLQAAKQKHQMDMQKLAAEHIGGIQSQEAQQRTEALKAVNAATSRGQTSG